MIWISGSQSGLEPSYAPLPRRLVGADYTVLMLGKKGVDASGGDWHNETFADCASATDAAYQRMRDDKLTPEAAWSRTRYDTYGLSKC